MWWRAARGAALAALWFYTVIAGFFVLYAPVLPLLLIDRAIYRIVVDEIFSLWQLYPVALFQWIFKCELHHYGDFLDPKETCIIIINHRTRVDWNYAWIALYHACRKSPMQEHENVYENKIKGIQSNDHSIKSSDTLQSTENNNLETETITGIKSSDLKMSDDGTGKDKTLFSGENYLKTIVETYRTMYERIIFHFTSNAKLKLVLKDQIRLIPAVGWIMQLNCFLFLKRNWNEDQRSVSDFLEYYRNLQRKYQYNMQLLIFPEGTDLSPSNQRASDAYAEANNLKPYDFVLHPRSTGFAVLTSRLRDAALAAVYDVTLAYDKPPASELSLVRGDAPGRVYVNIKRYPAAHLPRGEDRLRRWLNDRWTEKETDLRYFHNHGTFRDSTLNPPRALNRARLAFFFWTCVDVFFAYAVVQSGLFQFWVTYNVLLFAIVTWHFGGFHIVQSSLLSY